MSNHSISEHEVEAFRRFVTHLPRENDATLAILKGHLLIEEQVRNILEERVAKPKAIKEAQLDCFQAICLAEAFCNDESNPDLWDTLKKLNNLRNDIAHKIEDRGLTKKMTNFVELVEKHSILSDAKPANASILLNFDFALWIVFCQVAALVKPTSPRRADEHSVIRRMKSF